MISAQDERSLSTIWARQQLIGDPVFLMRAAGKEPDPWQVEVLRSTAPRIILNASRQSGKSQITATAAVALAESKPNSLILIGAPSQNQSAELLQKAMQIYGVGGAGVGLDANAVLRATLSNGSRLICVPGSQATVRSYSAVDLIVVDEAAYVEDEYYQAIAPMIAVSGGRLMLLSTPHAKQGTFYEIWEHAPVYDPAIPDKDQQDAWMKVLVTWRDCPRITEQFIEEYRSTYGDFAYLREFEAVFSDALEQVFTRDEVDGMLDPTVEAWSVF